MKCLLTGATGFVGCVLARRLIELGHIVTAYIRKSSSLKALNGLPVNICVGELDDCALLEKEIEKCDAVFHAAAIIDISGQNYDAVYKINYLCTRSIADLCLKHGKKLIFIGSVQAIADKTAETVREPDFFTEDGLTDNYGRTKALASDYITQLSKKGLRSVILMPTAVVGPCDYRISSLSKFLLDCVNNKVNIRIDGGYNFVDVRDVALAAIAAAETDCGGESFIISGEYYSVTEIEKYFEKLSGRKKIHLKIPFGLAYAFSPVVCFFSELARKTPVVTPFSLETIHTVINYDCSKAKRLLNFSPTPISKTLKDTYEWYGEMGLLK